MNKTMGTVDKALALLEFFTVSEPEWGLSELARASGRDKATTLRLLGSFIRHGVIEQHAVTKKFRLGRNILKLARVREASFPVASLVEPALQRLAAETGETAHAALATGSAMITIGVVEPQRSTRVYVNPSQPLPYHATASGIAYLAYSDDAALEAVLQEKDFKAHTAHTARSRGALLSQISDARQRGFAISARTFEVEVIGIAAPFFDGDSKSYGTIAVASVASRLTQESMQTIAAAVRRAAIEVTSAMGGEPPPEFLEAKEIAA